MRILVDHSGPNGLGDIVMQLPLYEALADRHPAARISSRGSRLVALGNPHVADLDESSPVEGFDLVVRPTWKTILGVEATLPWFKAYLLAQGLPAHYGPPRAYLFPQEIKTLQLPVEVFGSCEAPTRATGRPHGEGARPSREAPLVVGFSADSITDPSRRWPLERYVTVLRHLRTRYGVHVVELGAGYSAPHLGVGLNLIGRTSIREAMALLHCCDLFLGNHGGLTHLATAVGTPLLSPWGSSTSLGNFTFHPWSAPVSLDLPCKYCQYHGNRRPECQIGFDRPGLDVATCMDLITVDEMVARAEALIELLTTRRADGREEKRRHLARPADYPASVEADATVTAVTPKSNFFEALGQIRDLDLLLARPMVVAAPEWQQPDSTWPAIVREYVAGSGADYPFVLWLLVGPQHGLTFVEARELVRRCARESSLATAEPPPILLVGGYVSSLQLAGLLQRARAYLRTGGPGELARVALARQQDCPVLGRLPT